MKKIKKKAFTLAETLITLGIIGIVAAMTLPTVITNCRNRELQTQFKKTYSELNQISQMFYQDYGISIAEYCSSTSCTNFIDNIFPEYLKGVQKTSNWTYNDKDDNNSSITTMPYALYTLDKTPVKSICDNHSHRMDIIGRIYSFNDTPASGYNGPVVCVDINGQKKPNTYGMDFFLFIFTVDGYVIPMGQEHKNNASKCTSSTGECTNFSNTGSEYCSATNASNLSTNTSCAYYALSDTNPEGNGTYWKNFLKGK